MPVIDRWKAVFVQFLLKGTKDGNIQNVISYSIENARITNIWISVMWKVFRSRSSKKCQIYVIEKKKLHVYVRYLALLK